MVSGFTTMIAFIIEMLIHACLVDAAFKVTV
jgi:hypothetical protein